MKNILIICVILMMAGCASNPQTKRYNESDSQKVDDNSPEMINVKMGVAYFERNDYDTAIEKFKRALAHNPKLAIAHSGLALVYSTMNAMSDAEKHYEQSIKLAPDDPVILNNYGTFLCQNGKFLEAVEYYRKTLSNPFYKTPETVRENMGVCLMQADQVEEAEFNFREALKVNPNLHISLYNMVILSARKGDSMTARAFVQRLESIMTLDERMLKVAYEVEKKLGNNKMANQYLAQLRKIKK